MRHWHTHIRNATTWQQLLQVARDYLASLEPREWAEVPEACRPTRIKGVDDIDYWHRRLQDEFLPVASRPDVTDAHRRMLGFFRAAAERAQEFYGVATPPSEGATNDDSGAVPPKDASAGRSRD
jgi:hypothetical protein